MFSVRCRSRRFSRWIGEARAGNRYGCIRVEPDIDAAAFIKTLHVIKALHGSGALEIVDDGSITLDSSLAIF